MDEHDELEFDDFQEEEEEETSEAKPANHYVDNKEFYQAMIEWKKEVLDARDSGEPDPPVTDYIGKCFLDLPPIYPIDPTSLTILIGKR